MKDQAFEECLFVHLSVTIQLHKIKNQIKIKKLSI